MHDERSCSCCVCTLSEAPGLPAIATNETGRFEYVLGTHLFFSPGATPTLGGIGGAAEGGAAPGGGDGGPDAGANQMGDAAGGGNGVGRYTYFGKASKRIVFRPVLLNPK